MPTHHNSNATDPGEAKRFADKLASIDADEAERESRAKPVKSGKALDFARSRLNAFTEQVIAQRNGERLDKAERDALVAELAQGVPARYGEVLRRTGREILKSFDDEANGALVREYARHGALLASGEVGASFEVPADNAEASVEDVLNSIGR
jgi:hypothetical protein